MNRYRLIRVAKLVASGVILLQAAGCGFTAFNEFVQTMLLGVTAAGAVAILQNI